MSTAPGARLFSLDYAVLAEHYPGACHAMSRTEIEYAVPVFCTDAWVVFSTGPDAVQKRGIDQGLRCNSETGTDSAYYRYRQSEVPYAGWYCEEWSAVRRSGGSGQL
eukprot:1647455-Rhodomonas_salina.1